MIQKNCKTCNKIIIKKITESVKYFNTKKYCSQKCKRLSSETKEKIRIINLGRPFRPYSSKEVNCVICNKTFRVWNARIEARRGKCCSKECSKELMKTSSYLVTRSEEQRKKDNAKAAKTNSGERHYWWLGGITPLRMQIHHMKEYSEWRRLCFVRDEYRCIFCGYTGNKLEVDHIKPFSYIRYKNNIKSVDDARKCDELWDTNNGRTLCRDCHRKTDTYGYLANIKKGRFSIL